jgi:hypothetical protein
MNLGWKGIEEGKGHDFSDILAVLMYDCGREPSRAGLIVDFSRIGQFSRNFFDINTSDTTILNLERVPHVFNTSSRDLQSCARQQRPKVWLDQAARHHGATILGSSHMIVLAPFRGSSHPQATSENVVAKSSALPFLKWDSYYVSLLWVCLLIGED